MVLTDMRRMTALSYSLSGLELKVMDCHLIFVRSGRAPILRAQETGKDKKTRTLNVAVGFCTAHKGDAPSLTCT